MTVTDLRQMLGKRGLDDDGSKTKLALRVRTQRGRGLRGNLIGFDIAAYFN